MTSADTPTPAGAPATAASPLPGRRAAASRPAGPIAPPPASAERVFGPELGLARAYAELLATDGTAHGHLGPREVPRLWERHLLNCAVVTDLLPDGARVVDVGSGAGLPGLPMALRRPDLRVVLVEPMLRRTAFLEQCIATLGLQDRVSVLRGRAETPEMRSRLDWPAWITARAVAPLDRLADWCLPLLAPGGRLLALKGATVRAEIASGGPVLSSQRVAAIEVVTIGARYDLEPTTVAVVTRGSDARRTRPARTARATTAARLKRPRRQGTQ